MKILTKMIKKAAKNPRSIVLAEGHDPRIIEAAANAQNDKIANITLLGNPDIIRPLARAAGDRDDAIIIIDPNIENIAYTQAYFERRSHKGISLSDARAAMCNPLNYANIMTAIGDVDGSVAGAINITGDVVRSALQTLGIHPDYSLVSSFFIMLMPQRDNAPIQGGVIYADCGLVIEPSESELVQIAAAAADNGKALLGLDPKIAMLSFSTKGSADHPVASKMQNAARALKTARPDLTLDGELQFDAAIMPDIAARKAPTSELKGEANIFIFPDLNSGNIAYKITQRLGGAQAIGPILQGLSKPANDLSRGANTQDIYNMIVITVLQAQNGQ